LAIYDRIITSEVFKQLSKDHDLVVKVATLPNLAAVVLIRTITHPFAVNNIEPKTETEWDLTAISQNHTLSAAPTSYSLTDNPSK